MTPILKVGLITIVALVVGLVVQWWPSRADPKSPDMYVRLTAVSELIGSSDQDSLDTLGEFVGDTELRVARAAIRAIGSRRDEASRLKLGQIVATNKSGMLRGTAAAELGDFKKTDYRLLTDILLNDKSPEVRAGAARGLKRLRNSASLDSLIKALTDPHPETRRNAFEAIGAVTRMYFRFDATASPEVRAKHIAGIKKQLVECKCEHPH